MHRITVCTEFILENHRESILVRESLSQRIAVCTEFILENHRESILVRESLSHRINFPIESKTVEPMYLKRGNLSGPKRENGFFQDILTGLLFLVDFDRHATIRQLVSPPIKPVSVGMCLRRFCLTTAFWAFVPCRFLLVCVAHKGLRGLSAYFGWLIRNRCWFVKKYCWLVCVREKYCSG